jgi:spermidine dehydrogenase
MGKQRDRELGMDRPVSRRDILHGFGALAASSFVPGTAIADEIIAAEKAGHPYYPPALTGMRGNHDGSFDVAHKLAREGKRDWGPVEEPDSGTYDLVVVGAGLSGLAAAHFYLQENPQARILLLDNHDDFGGHATRNEFDIDGRTYIGYGGSQSLESPSFYPSVAKEFLRDLGIDKDRLGDAYDQEFFKRNGLAAGVHFNSNDWGSDHLVRFGLGDLRYIPFAPTDLTAEEAVAQMPISDAARAEFLRLLTTDTDQTDIPRQDKEEYLYSISYREFLERHLDIHEPDVFAVLQDLAIDYGAGIEAAHAAGVVEYMGLPGAMAMGISDYNEDEPYIHHFPDGNASVARLMVRNMIPDVASGSTADDILMARFNYSKLDVATSPVRLRLNSTAVHVENIGDPGSATEVDVDYVLGGQAYRVRAKHCVLACYNSIIPFLCPDLPAQQLEALRMGVRTPMLYTTVMLHNWRAWKNLGIGGVVSSGSFHANALLDFPVSWGGQDYPDSPDDPITVHMERFPHFNNKGLSPRDQRRLGLYELLATTFETMERNIREQLAGFLSAGGFDPARDIAGITVNRWAHGYADGFEDLGEPWYGGKNSERAPNVIGRKRHGRIAIANSDAGASAMLESAVVQAHRAISELS